jgi:acetolactate synthase small subunit
MGEQVASVQCNVITVCRYLNCVQQAVKLVRVSMMYSVVSCTETMLVGFCQGKVSEVSPKSLPVQVEGLAYRCSSC